MRLAAVAMTVLLTMAGPGTAAADSHSRLDRVRAAGALRVCMWPDYYAVSYRNPRTFELQGIDIDMARALAGELGVEARFVDSNFSHFVDDLADERCDIAMFAIGVTRERAERVAFSVPYLRSGIYAVTTRTHPRIREWGDIDQAGVVVAVQKDTLMEGFARSSLTAAQVVAVTRSRGREEEVQSGRADVILTDFPYGQRMLAFHAWARLIAPEPPVQVTPYAYAVAQGDPMWLARVNRFVADAKRDGRLAAYARRNGLTPIVARE